MQEFGEAFWLVLAAVVALSLYLVEDQRMKRRRRALAERKHLTDQEFCQHLGIPEGKDGVASRVAMAVRQGLAQSCKVPPACLQPADLVVGELGKVAGLHFDAPAVLMQLEQEFDIQLSAEDGAGLEWEPSTTVGALVQAAVPAVEKALTERTQSS